MKKLISHSKPTITKNDIRAVLNTVRSEDLAQDKKVLEFEGKFTKYQNCKEAVATNSGTSALHLALLSLDISKGDEVIIPSYVCTAVMNAVKYTGAKVRLADINNEDFNISLKSVKILLNRKTKAIVVPHMFGLPSDIKPLLSLGVPLIEDCAQSLGATYSGKKVGTFGLLSIFSFYATKVITTGEGGMVTSNNTKLIRKIRDLRDYDNKPIYRTRYNYKMTDFQAALGISQLSQLPNMIKERRVIASYYNRSLQKCDIKIPTALNKKQSHIYYRYVIQSKNSRNKILKHLSDRKISCSIPVFKPLHRYLKLGNYPATDKAMKECLSIPIYPSLSTKNTQHIIKCIKEIT